MFHPVLIIEDDPDISESLKYNLERENLRTVVAATGEAGLTAALNEKEPPSLIILDLMLPGMSGIELCRRLRREPATRRTPIIMLTAKASESDRVAGLDLGADDYLTKPVAKADLLNAIQARFRRSEQQLTSGSLTPNFDSYEPLLALGLTPRVAEVLLWVAQGKTNADIATILEISEWTVKKHVLEIFEKLGVETRTAASLRAIEVLSSRREARASF